MPEQQRNSNYTIPPVDFNSLNLRINPDKLLLDIEIFLKGEKEELYEDDNGNVSSRTVKIGLRKANQVGIQSIMSYLKSCLNTHNVLGYFPEDKYGYCKQYEDYCYYFHTELIEYLMLNMYEYEIDDNEIDGIVDFIMNMVRPFMTRLINGREAQALVQTVKTEEKTSYEPEKKKFGII